MSRTGAHSGSGGAPGARTAGFLRGGALAAAVTFHAALPHPWTEAALALIAGFALGLVARLVLLRYALPIARRTPTKIDEVMLEVAATPAAFTFAVLGAAQAARLVWPTREGDVLRWAISALVVVWGWALARLVTHLLLQGTSHASTDPRARGALLLGRFAKVVAAVVILLTLLALWNVSITPLVASAGIAGIALALAAQDTLANLFAGIAVYMDRIYEIGDTVVLDEGSGSELRGEVKDVGLRSTRIMTHDDVVIIVPNSVIANGRVVNESASRGSYRVRVRVPVDQESDLPTVERALLDVGAAHPRTRREPAPQVRVRLLDEAAIHMELLVWIANPRERGSIVSDLNKAIHARFRAEGIKLAFPYGALGDVL